MTLLLPKLAQFALLLLSDEHSNFLNSQYDTTFFGLFKGMRPYNEIRPGGYVYASNSLLDRPELESVLQNAGVIIFTKYATIAVFANHPRIKHLYDPVIMNVSARERLAAAYASTNFTLRLAATKGIPPHMLTELTPYITLTSIDFTDIPTVAPLTSPAVDSLVLDIDEVFEDQGFQFDQVALEAHLRTHQYNVTTFRSLLLLLSDLEVRAQSCEYCREIAFRVRLVLQDADVGPSEQILLLWNTDIQSHRNSGNWSEILGSSLSLPIASSTESTAVMPMSDHFVLLPSPETTTTPKPTPAPPKFEKSIPFWLVVQSRHKTKWVTPTPDGSFVIPAWDLNVVPSQLVQDSDSFPSYKDYLKQVFYGAPAQYVIDACV